jgi:predicted secreted protein
LNAAQGNVAVKAPIGDISVTAPVGTVSVNGGTAKLSGQLSATIQAGANLDLKGGALAQVNAPLVQLGGACVPVALLGGLVSTPPMGGVGTIASGSNAVCAAP